MNGAPYNQAEEKGHDRGLLAFQWQSRGGPTPSSSCAPRTINVLQARRLTGRDTGAHGYAAQPGGRGGTAATPSSVSQVVTTLGISGRARPKAGRKASASRLAAPAAYVSHCRQAPAQRMSQPLRRRQGEKQLAAPRLLHCRQQLGAAGSWAGRAGVQVAARPGTRSLALPALNQY